MQLVEPRPKRPMPIRITPLIDVVFILLVFFMLTTRLLPVDYLELANDTRAHSPVTGEPVPTLTVTAQGLIRWQGETLAQPELINALHTAGIQEVNLATEADTPLAAFTATLSLLDGHGITTHWQRAH